MTNSLNTRVTEALDKIRPYLEADGGNISLVEITKDNVVKVELHGTCVGCSMSMMTMKAGVEQSIKSAAPEITRVVAINPEFIS
jgi:Fe-S cluster biogenesis protein NfuA|tara:strand:+ start:10883 stop:11134 length:252 start_codon:yes stop_codon:yes gene_type:complete